MSEPKNKIQLFEGQQVRHVWDEENEKYWLSVLDVLGILTEQPDYEKTKNYWKWLKKKLRDEGSELVSDTTQLDANGQPVSNTTQLKLLAPDGKMRKTDVMDAEQILRLIQSIPSKKAEPFKMWLAKVGNERLDEMVDPELSIERAIQNYRRLGYSENWINQRIKSIEVRTELVLNMLAEVAATDISAAQQPVGFAASAEVAKRGAKAAKVAREQIESETGKSAVSSLNAKNLGQRQISLIDGDTVILKPSVSETDGGENDD